MMTKNNPTNKEQNLFFQSLKGPLLVAMPGIDDLRFNKTVIYIYEHTQELGAHGIVINKPAVKMSFNDILNQLKIDPVSDNEEHPQILLGGPDQITHGFIVHSGDYFTPETCYIQSNVAITSTQDILEDIAQGKGPENKLIALGCASWIRGQLEDEIMSNVWLTVPATWDLLFETPFDQKWSKAIETLGVNHFYLTNISGKA